MKAADFYSAFNPIVHAAIVDSGGVKVGKRQSVWNIVEENERLVLRFATNYKYPWTESDGGTFNFQAWRVPRTAQDSTVSDLGPHNSLRALDYLDEVTYSEMHKLNASINRRSPLAMEMDRYASKMRFTLQAQGFPVHPDNLRLNTSPDLRYFDSYDVESWGVFFSRALPAIICGAKDEPKYVFSRAP